MTAQELAATMLRQQAEQIETERMKLVACGVVAMADTPDSARIAREMHVDYRSASLDDVIRRVDECMALRSEVQALKADAERYQWYVAQLESGNLDKLEEAFRNMERVEIVTKQMFDAAIDAMKGKS